MRMLEADRARATTALVELGAPAVKPLAGALRDGNRQQRELAMSLLVAMDREKPAAELPGQVISELAADLFDEGTHAATSSLVIFINPDPKEIRWSTRYISPAAGENGARLLACTGGEIPVKALMAVFRKAAPTQRELAAILLARMDRKRVPPPVIGELVTALLRDLDDDAKWVRYAAESGLVEVGDPAVEAIARQLNDVSPAKRETAVDLLGRIGGDKAVKALIAALDDEYAPIREETVTALERAGDRRAVPHLKRLAEKDPEESVRLAAERAMKKLAETRPSAP